MKKHLKIIIGTMIILILIAINIIIFLNYKKSENSDNVATQSNTIENTNNTITNTSINENEEIDNQVKNKITNMPEGNRVRAYYGQFIEAIENKNFDIAYEYLNNDFKANYFKTVQEFSEYMMNKYPKNRIVVKYNSVERKGEVFVLSVTIDDATDTNFQAFSENVVIREISMNNFSLSFTKDDLTRIERSK